MEFEMCGKYGVGICDVVIKANGVEVKTNYKPVVDAEDAEKALRSAEIVTDVLTARVVTLELELEQKVRRIAARLRATGAKMAVEAEELLKGVGA